MKLFELHNNMYEPTEDHLNRYDYDDTRKPKLTLRHLNKLRKMREFKKVDMQDRRDFWKVMYGTSEPAAMPGPAF